MRKIHMAQGIEVSKEQLAQIRAGTHEIIDGTVAETAKAKYKRLWDIDLQPTIPLD